MKRSLTALAVSALMSIGAAHAQGSGASAAMTTADGAEAGTVSFDQTASGLLHVFVEMAGLPPGPHGFHIHETGECSAEGGFESAGGHLAGNMEHGSMAEGGPHPGDFPNVHVGEGGVLKVEFFSERLTLDEGENGLFDADGSAVVVHADPDDYESQPSGEAGDRIACGVIEKAE